MNLARKLLSMLLLLPLVSVPALHLVGDGPEVGLEVGGVPVTLVDTAGLRETADPVEAEGVRRALTRARSFAKPKSSTMALPSPPSGLAVTITLPGLRSPWTSPCAWIAATPCEMSCASRRNSSDV